jgi:hypothetical protein
VSAYRPAEGVYVGRPPCVECGANFNLHRALEARATTSTQLAQLHRNRVPLLCPEAYRPSTLEEARRGLADAERSGDEARVFVARGELQRLAGRG